MFQAKYQLLIWQDLTIQHSKLISTHVLTHSHIWDMRNHSQWVSRRNCVIRRTHRHIFHFTEKCYILLYSQCHWNHVINSLKVLRWNEESEDGKYLEAAKNLGSSATKLRSSPQVSIYKMSQKILKCFFLKSNKHIDVTSNGPRNKFIEIGKIYLKEQMFSFKIWI